MILNFEISDSYTMKRLQYPPENEILYLKGIVNYTEFHLKNGKKLISSFTLRRHQEKHTDFLRVSKSHLINPDGIKKVKTSGTDKTVILKNGDEVKVSRRIKNVISENL